MNKYEHIFFLGLTLISFAIALISLMFRGIINYMEFFCLYLSICSVLIPRTFDNLKI